jgi:hypothetical protein
MLGLVPTTDQEKGSLCGVIEDLFLLPTGTNSLVVQIEVKTVYLSEVVLSGSTPGAT